jgi:hypothetical protein
MKIAGFPVIMVDEVERRGSDSRTHGQTRGQTHGRTGRGK